MSPSGITCTTVKVLQIRVREIGDRGEMIEVDRFRRQSLAGQMNVVRARPAAAKATASTRTSASTGPK